MSPYVPVITAIYNFKIQLLNLIECLIHKHGYSRRAAFEGCGELVEVKIVMDKISKRSKGYAFIEYTTEEAASAALREMNGKLYVCSLIILIFSKKNSSSRFNLGVSTGQVGSNQPHKNDGSIKLFVFGDSYADTGNVGKSVSPSWKEPYGITFPGKPAGRFSDGRVLTDYLAQFLGIRSPLPYALRKYAKKSKLENGMNFAYGGTGVFDTLVSGPNLTTQIGFFQLLLEQEKVYDKRDLIKSSVALVSVAGNDYTSHFVKPGNGSKMHLCKE
ncbi:GDSL esterase/lipase At5g03610-like [Pyrus x bretschneideri]|uniref:GDSL esterase/lipase At5g03610-like n=1 Tax=Pyrus x bretschneideri TaxID=225117 RepID=UPI00202F1D49|nr:GDSL esterase/lipase At5g03610-like [Pyrus x bretschneideri]